MRTPPIYIFRLLCNRVSGRFFALLKFRRPIQANVHYSSKVWCPSKISTKGRLSIGPHCFVDALSTEGIQFGKRCTLGKYTCIECTGTIAWLGKGLKVGDNTGLGTHGFYGCAGGVEIGNNVMIGNYVSFHSENHNFADLDKTMQSQGVSRLGIKVGNDCWIGAKATILDGANIGNGCIVAAGSLVTKGNYPDFSILGGVPAKVIRSRKSKDA